MTAIRADAHEDVIRMRDGRALAYAEYGDLSGVPVFFFHGGGDSRLQRHPDDGIAAALGVRLICIDRPGIGRSDHRPRRRLLDWPGDVSAVADHLDIGKFAILGYSMGGPHALACAYQMPERLTRVGVACGIAPFDRPHAMDGMLPFHARLFRLARRSHRFVQAPLAIMARQARRDPVALLDRLISGAPAYDHGVYSRIPGRRENQEAAIAEAARMGARGLAWELAMTTRPWGFSLEDIQAEVRLWYGTADRITPPQMAQYVATRLPRMELTMYKGEGHQLVFMHWAEILEALAP